MTKLILLRHGQSLWNEAGRFTGWVDIDLSERGREEAREAGKRLREEGIVVDIIFTSVLKRAIRTAWIVMDEMDLMWVPLLCSWRLNERHYGALQGLSKADMVQKYGEGQVHAWRRGYDVHPPPLDPSSRGHPMSDPRYRDLQPDLLPSSESLKDTLNRTLPCWHEEILPHLQKGANVLIAAHGNSLRALVKHLDNIADDDISEVNIPTGIPLIYELEGDVIRERHYLASGEELARAVGEAARVR